MEKSIIVITGASSGIGEQAALQLASKHVHLCLIARRHDELARVQALIMTQGGTASIYPTDLSKGEDVDDCAAAILADHKRVDVLVNNAGRSIRRSIIQSLDRDHDFQRTMQINYHAAVRLTMRLLPSMLEHHRGHIINITTMAVQTATPGYAAYIASKMALEGYSRVLSSEMAGRGIAVTLIRYPLVRTAMSSATDLYQNMPMMGPEHAAKWIIRAIHKRPARIGTLSGQMIEAANVFMPGITEHLTGRLYRFLGKKHTATTK